ncbi:MAG: homoserine dehydrogenase, partial [Acidiphilium sp.]
MSKRLAVGVAGLGTVGAGVVRLLRDNAAEITARAGRPIEVVAVSARDRGRDRGLKLDLVSWHEDAVTLAADPAVDVVVELIGGAAGAARVLIEAAAASGKPVVTANKALIAEAGAALPADADIRFEAAVAGGIPVIKALREGLAANRVESVAGILNGTCNYILSRMRAERLEFADVLAEAQALGYAEADPSFDIDGVDTAHKLAILAAIAFGRQVDFASVHIEGIRRVSALDIAFAEELGYRIKLLGIARATSDGIETRVYPAMVPLASPLAHVDGVNNAVVIHADPVGAVVLQGRGAGAAPTASAVVADLVDLARGRRTPMLGVAPDALALRPSLP